IGLLNSPPTNTNDAPAIIVLVQRATTRVMNSPTAITKSPRFRLRPTNTTGSGPWRSMSACIPDSSPACCSLGTLAMALIASSTPTKTPKKTAPRATSMPPIKPNHAPSPCPSKRISPSAAGIDNPMLKENKICAAFQRPALLAITPSTSAPLRGSGGWIAKPTSSSNGADNIESPVTNLLAASTFIILILPTFGSSSLPQRYIGWLANYSSISCKPTCQDGNRLKNLRLRGRVAALEGFRTLTVLQ